MNLMTPHGDQHLTYCTNVHPAQTGDEVRRVLAHDVVAVRQALAHDPGTPPGPFGVGLRVSDEASRDLGTAEGIRQLRALLEEHGLYVFTLNGFPYGAFHGTSVKDAVHRPDWTEPARLAYLQRLAHLLAGLDLPHDEGSISTSPLGYRGHHADPRKAREDAARALATLCRDLHHIEQDTGRWIHVDLEPEPDGLLEQIDDAADFFADELLTVGRRHLATLAQITEPRAETWLRRYLGVCVDVCHAAVAFEALDDGLAALAAEGIAVGKVQLSSALHARFGDTDQARTIAEALRPFDEPVYLHQVVVRLDNGETRRFGDLGPALEVLPTLPPGTLRTHFHVPLFLDDYGVLGSTQSAVTAVLERQRTAPFTRHLEVETYTWDVLPAPLQTERANAIARELAWVLEHA